MGFEVDDFSFTWYRASHDLIGPFFDRGDGRYTSSISSDLEGTANISCIYYDAQTPLVTDGQGDNSASYAITFVD